jgi:glycosyltransferase involved in cell wall biosynthesis
LWPYPMLYEAVYGEAYLCWKQLLASADAFPSAGIGNGPQQALRLARSNGSNADVDVIIPTFNQGHLLVDCIASVEEAAAQTSGTVIELLVVDDGTTDPSSKKILSQLSDLGYRIQSIPNGGLSNARNVGIGSTSAPLIIPLDDDNLLQSGYLIEGVEMMHQNEGIAVVYGDREDFGLRCQTYRPGTVCFEDLLVMNRVDACALIRRFYVESCDGYDTSLPALEDWDLWLKILSLSAEMAYLPKVCFSYCHRSSSMTERMLDHSGLLENLVSIIRSRY